jgi:hypothetical protein
MTLLEARSLLSGPLKFGDLEQIKARKVLEACFAEAEGLYVKLHGQPHGGHISDEQLLEMLPDLQEMAASPWW